MDKFRCKKCGSNNTEIEEKGTQIGLYCCDCGKWIKWLSQEEVRVFNAHCFSKDDVKKALLNELIDISHHCIDVSELRSTMIDMRNRLNNNLKE